jgi:predicted DNA-binding protein (UPF0251 family)
MGRTQVTEKIMNYKAPDNSLHVIEPQFAHLLPAGCVEITEEEAEAVRLALAAPPTIKQQTDAICSAKGVTREVVWAVILATEGAARATALAMDYPEAAVLAEAYQRMKLYRECKDVEAACRVLEIT